MASDDDDEFEFSDDWNENDLLEILSHDKVPERRVKDDELDIENTKTWLFPEHWTIRDYQKNIIESTFHANTLVALPTGLGKTLIASICLYNWLRWAPESLAFFTAPTKPLLQQQQEAYCNTFKLKGDQVAYLDGSVASKKRANQLQGSRLIFATPQILCSLISKGDIDAKRVICVVIDEAHRTKGNYSYSQLITALKAQQSNCRIIALTATPGVTRESVSEVLKNLHISNIQFRSRQSPDISDYVQPVNEETIEYELDNRILQLRELLSQAISQLFTKLKSAGAIPYIGEPAHLTLFSIIQCRTFWFSKNPGTGNGKDRNWVFPYFSALSTFAAPMDYLQIYGIRVFFDCLEKIYKESKEQAGGSRLVKDICKSKSFQTLMEQKSILKEPNFFGHPKLEGLITILKQHFQVNESDSNDFKQEDSRVMIFTSIRQSAQQIVDMIHQYLPVKASIFIGQATSAQGISGMKRKDQSEIIEKFKKGEFHILVATSIGEEGLDIGEIDLVISYDQSGSLVRNRQRVGRTGRKQAGNIYNLCVQGKEATKLKKALASYEELLKDLKESKNLPLEDKSHHRILPFGIQPEFTRVKVSEENKKLSDLGNFEKLDSLREQKKKKIKVEEQDRSSTLKKPEVTRSLSDYYYNTDVQPSRRSENLKLLNQPI